MSEVLEPLTVPHTPDTADAPHKGGAGTPPQAPERHPSRWRRRLWLTAWFAVFLLIVTVCAGGLGATWMVRSSFPTVSGKLTVPGLQGDVTVRRDGAGIPQIYADTPHDLFLAQGYVQAQDRFWEMDVRRHITSGSLAELFGEGQVETDSLIRTMGWRRVAQKEVSLLSTGSRNNLTAFSAGVNAYLKDHQGADLSAEYPILALGGLDYTPASWSPVDSVAWFKALAWNLNGTLSDQIRHALLATTLTDKQVDTLFPEYDHERWQSIVEDGASSQGTVPGKARGSRPADTRTRTAASPTRPLKDTSDALDQLDGVLGPRGTGIGSNSWVVAGSRTTSGKPLLANDPHLAPSMPGTWYQIGLHCTRTGPDCPYDVSGFGFSGMPGVIIGHNARIGWGVTNLAPADMDLYVEKVSGSRYEFRDEKLPLRVRKEVLKVANGKDRTITIRSTRHGPIISDSFPKAESVATKGRMPGVPRDGSTYAVAMRWSALDPGRTMDAVFALNKAAGWKDFRSAAALFSSPAQNLTYADRRGHIGYQAPGRIPVRARGEGRYPVPGWTGEHEWKGYIPFDKLPRSYDPKSGYIVTANNAVVDDDYPHLITRNWGDGYRSQRITDLIERAGKLDTADMRRIQLDAHNANAETLVPHLLRAKPAGKKARQAQRLLRDWDFQQGADSASAAYFNAVWSHLLKLTFRDDLAGNPAKLQVDGGGQWYEIVRKLLDRPDDAWWRNSDDPRKLRDRDDVLRAAMQDAARELTHKLGDDPEKWRWGALHQLVLRNDTLGTGGPAPVQWLLNHEPIEVGGGSSTVNATGWDASKGYEVNWVPSMRMVVDFADFDDSRWINLTGASGHAFNDHYDDQTELWRKGEFLPWPSGRTAVRDAAHDTLALVPDGTATS
ncbi:penicillin acylase family protein [Streptomyces sp. NPDC005438]|uniref:penicillin acylase family protein n=1 Tax=Streptomyces sp. NPDC005438 TaxID=3156880 RepID=UPI0033AAA319